MKNIFRKMHCGFVRCDVGLFHRFRKPPYGGANQFFLALRKELLRRGCLVRANCINRGTRFAVINSFDFDLKLLRRLRHADCKIVHRMVGPVFIYRGTSDLSADMKQWQVNREFADATVFQSEYSRHAHEKLGVKFKNPVVITNAVDRDIFYPMPLNSFDGQKVRLIATSWSNHPNKGKSTYEWLDQNLDWSRVDLTFVGRIEAKFKNIKTISPLPSEKLAEVIRQHDAFITASLHETCSNSLLEGLACGLPVIYADSGANSEIVGEAGFAFRQPEEIPALIEKLRSEYDGRRQQVRVQSIDQVVDAYLSIEGLL